MGICSTPTKQESMKTLQKNTYKIDTSFITK